MNDLVFRELSLDEIREVYYADMVLQFPDMERRSFANISDMIARGIYAGYGLFAGGEIRAYALAAMLKEFGVVLLDYLAVPDRWKNRGYGSDMLNRIRSHFNETDRILIETEDPDALSGEEAAIAQRRLGFYARNGFAETSVLIDLFSVRYRLYISGRGSESDEELKKTMEGVYRVIVAPKYYEKNVHLEIRGEG